MGNKHPLKPSALAVAQEAIKLAVRPQWAKMLRTDSLTVEVQVISYGSLALVAIAGEPFIQIAGAIQEASPFPHTVVLGYSNGGGVGYVGLPGELARKGFESWMAKGEDRSGQVIVDTASSLLRRLHTAQKGLSLLDVGATDRDDE